MKKLNLAIIGQGRSGRNIHGLFYKKDENVYFNVKYVVDADAFRRERALKEYPGCEVFASHTDLYGLEGIDLVVNSTYSDFHYSITKDLLEHGFNVLVEKPFARSRSKSVPSHLPKSSQKKRSAALNAKRAPSELPLNTTLCGP